MQCMTLYLNPASHTQIEPQIVADSESTCNFRSDKVSITIPFGSWEGLCPRIQSMGATMQNDAGDNEAKMKPPTDVWGPN